MAVEPAPDNFEALSRNAIENPPRVWPIQAALWGERSAPLTVLRTKDSGDSLGDSQTDSHGAEDRSFVVRSDNISAVEGSLVVGSTIGRTVRQLFRVCALPFLFDHYLLQLDPSGVMKPRYLSARFSTQGYGLPGFDFANIGARPCPGRRLCQHPAHPPLSRRS